MIQNLEIRKQGEGYIILEQAGSNYHADQPVYEAASRGDAETWLADQGAAQDDVTRALNDAGTADRVLIEINGDYSEAEDFPRQKS